MHARYPGNVPSQNQEPGVRWLNGVSRALLEPHRHGQTKRSRQKTPLRVSSLFFGCMPVPSQRKQSKTDAIFFPPLKTLPSGTQMTMKRREPSCTERLFLKRLKTARHCWGRTAAAARWTDRSWHLL